MPYTPFTGYCGLGISFHVTSSYEKGLKLDFNCYLFTFLHPTCTVTTLVSFENARVAQWLELRAYRSIRFFEAFCEKRSFIRSFKQRDRRGFEPLLEHFPLFFLVFEAIQFRVTSNTKNFSVIQC